MPWPAGSATMTFMHCFAPSKKTEEHGRGAWCSVFVTLLRVRALSGAASCPRGLWALMPSDRFSKRPAPNGCILLKH